MLVSFLLLCLKLSLPLADCAGGARCEFSEETVTIANTKFENMTLTDPTLNGSCVCLNFCIFTCSDTEFVECAALNYGGAIFYYNQGKNSKASTIENCVFKKCAAVYGGAVYFYQSKHVKNEFVNCSFEENTADSGGAIHWTAQSGLIKNSRFSGNQAASGASLYLVNTCTNDHEWENVIDNTTFAFAPTDENPHGIVFVGTGALRPILIKNSCFFAAENGKEIVENSMFFIFAQEATVKFQEYNVFNGSANTIKITNMINEGEIEYNAKECIIKEFIPTTTTTSTTTTSTTTTSTSTTGSTTNTVSSDVNSASTDDEQQGGNNNDDEYNKAVKQFYLVIGSMAGVSVLIIVALVVVLILIRKRKADGTKYFGIHDDPAENMKERSEEPSQALRDSQLADDI